MQDYAVNKGAVPLPSLGLPAEQNLPKGPQKRDCSSATGSSAARGKSSQKAAQGGKGKGSNQLHPQLSLYAIQAPLD